MSSSAYKLEWARRNRDKVKAARDRYRAANKKKIAQRARVYAKTHRDKRIANQRRYRARHPDRAREKSRTWKREHAEAVRQYAQRPDVKARRNATSLERMRRKTAVLHDSYCKNRATYKTGLRAADVPPAVVDLIRTLLMIKRWRWKRNYDYTNTDTSR